MAQNDVKQLDYKWVLDQDKQIYDKLDADFKEMRKMYHSHLPQWAVNKIALYSFIIGMLVSLLVVLSGALVTLLSKSGTAIIKSTSSLISYVLF